MAYVSLMVTAGICPAEELWEGLASQSLRNIGQFADLCEARRGAMHSALRAAHDEVRHGLAVQDPTPYKGFRRAEFRETVAAMDVLPDDAPVAEVLAREIVITAEVASLAGHWAREGALVMGLSDKPDESSVPTPEDAARGLRWLHRTTMKYPRPAHLLRHAGQQKTVAHKGEPLTIVSGSFGGHRRGSVHRRRGALGCWRWRRGKRRQVYTPRDSTQIQPRLPSSAPLRCSRNSKGVK